mmetsp:Transcript_19290/g.29712  ORF Transcript_19290/g.29712 Transcript_19290/m.29712 type:complete len:418 (-) Transcript_19290:2696-3949(-)
MESFFTELGDARRLLQEESGGGINPYTSVGFIIWYCFVILCCGIPICCCCTCYWMSHRESNSSSLQELLDAMDQQQQEDLEVEISRIEANISTFTQEEQKRRKLMLEKDFKSRQKTLTKADLSTSLEDEASSVEKLSQHSGGGGGPSPLLCLSGSSCSICLTKYEIGDTVIKSTNPVCKHIFHADCLVSWLMTKQKPLCPCCRQTFTNVPYDDQAIPTSMRASSSPSSSSQGPTLPPPLISSETVSAHTDLESSEEERITDDDEEHDVVRVVVHDNEDHEASDTFTVNTDVESSEEERINGDNDDDDVVRVVVHDNEDHEASITFTVNTDVESSEEEERIADDDDVRVVVQENKNNETDETDAVEGMESMEDNNHDDDVEDRRNLAITGRELIDNQNDDETTVNSASLSPSMVKETI